jgi:DMSO reductase anchor subunit
LRIVFLLLGFVVPSALLAAALMSQAPSWSSSVSPLPALLALTFVVQYGGIAVERWFFLADSTHPQNLYYQGRS